MLNRQSETRVVFASCLCGCRGGCRRSAARYDAAIDDAGVGLPRRDRQGRAIARRRSLAATRAEYAEDGRAGLALSGQQSRAREQVSVPVLEHAVAVSAHGAARSEQGPLGCDGRRRYGEPQRHRLQPDARNVRLRLWAEGTRGGSQAAGRIPAIHSGTAWRRYVLVLSLRRLAGRRFTVCQPVGDGQTAAKRGGPLSPHG